MKKFIIIACAVALVVFLVQYAIYDLGVYVDFNPDAPVSTFMSTDEDTIYMERGG